MNDELRAQWREWLANNPEWVNPLAEFLQHHPEMVADKSKSQMYWHDLINVLVAPYAKQQLSKMDKGGNK